MFFIKVNFSLNLIVIVKIGWIILIIFRENKLS